MPASLSPAEVTRFDCDGFCGPIRVLEPEEAASYSARYKDLVRRRPEDRLKLKTKAHLLCPWVSEIAHNERILDAFESLIGRDILCYSMAFRVKPADGRTLAGWHQDTAYSQLKPILVIAALALGPCGREQGCLSVLPGTHKGPVLPHAESSDGTSILARGQSITAQLDLSSAVDLVLQPGEMAFFHYNIVHGSRPNISTEPRNMLLVEMMPASAFQAHGRESAMLVRGHDAYGHFGEDIPAHEECGARELENWQRAVSLRAKTIFAGSELPVSEAYGGPVKA